MHWYMRIDIPMYTLHRKIHHELLTIPVMSGPNCKEVLAHLQMLDKYNCLHPYDNIEKRLNLLLALIECTEPRTYAALKHQRDIVRKHFKAPQR